ncbi:MAG: hypothetical protein M1377_01770 [Deltaproteobacteria bacterium]|nr:hypothetical protein [Deltaproteobacteria bacterium]
MSDIEILLSEYNQLWDEKLIHKQSIRKFHHYLTYISAIGSLALTFHGISTTDFFKAHTDPQQATYLINNAKSIIMIVFVPFTPILLLTLIFAVNDLFHIYIMGNHIAQLEKRINNLNGSGNLLLWEHAVCPAVYGGTATGNNQIIISNLISAGDYLLLFPVLFLLGIITTYVGYNFLFDMSGKTIAYLYIGVVGYMVAVIIVLGNKLRLYTKSDGPLTKLIINISEGKNNSDAGNN